MGARLQTQQISAQSSRTRVGKDQGKYLPDNTSNLNRVTWYEECRKNITKISPIKQEESRGKPTEITNECFEKSPTNIENTHECHDSLWEKAHGMSCLTRLGRRLWGTQSMNVLGR